MIGKKYFFFISLILAGIFFSQCKKYSEDDVFIQWKKPEKRLIKYGPWEFEKLEVDGVDKSAEFRLDSAFCPNIFFSILEDYITPDLHAGNILGTYSLVEDKSTIVLSVYPNINKQGSYFFFYQDTSWEILRLSKKGMTLKTNYNSSEYKLYLKSDD
jgi:hypothetical protein